ncbi:MAG: hypothetical protein EA417_08190 [Gammaproteobacteria bacterium]|nr:MAG: hypothetical protein EA417_08190 [Gammaproteobacteria bacterium]
MTRSTMTILLLAASCCLVSAATAASELARCGAIESATERLDCFDAMVRQQADEQEALVQTPQAPERVAPDQAIEAPAVATASTPSTDPIAQFGQGRQKRPQTEIDSITSRVDSVRRTPLRHHVMTLANGQVWVENEPDRRRIAPAQDIVIRTHRWHFEMELRSQPNVAVHRTE